LAIPDPGKVLSPAEEKELVRLGQAGDERAFRKYLDELGFPDRLRDLLAVGVAAGVVAALAAEGVSDFDADSLRDKDLVGDSFGLSRFARAQRTGRLAKSHLSDLAARLKREKNDLRRNPRGPFNLGGSPSSDEFRETWSRKKREGAPPKELDRLLEAEISRVELEAWKKKGLRGATNIFWRYLDTEYHSAVENVRIDRMEARGVQLVQIVPMPGFCSICAPYAYRVYPIAQVPRPTYHPNCRCRARAITEKAAPIVPG